MRARTTASIGRMTMLNTLSMLGQKRLARTASGVLGVLVSTAYTFEAFRIPLGRTAEPGPGMFPRVVGIAGIVISLIVILEALLTDPVSGAVELPEGAQRRLVVLFAASTVGF